MAQYYNSSLRSLTYRLRKFKAILDEELVDEIMRNEPVIVEMVRQQLYAGEDGYKELIQPPYSPRTVKNKLRKGQPTDRVTLKDTGNFYKSLHVVCDEDGFYVESGDPALEDKLRAKYGSPILRLSNENLSVLLHNYIRPSLSCRLKEYIKHG